MVYLSATGQLHEKTRQFESRGLMSHWQSTYGGRKNCSIKTYMPLAISVKRKYLPSRSSVFSLSHGHSVCLLVRKFLGGGPAGVAYPRVWCCCAAMSRLATITSELVVLGAPASCLRASMAAEACRAGAIGCTRSIRRRRRPWSAIRRGRVGGCGQLGEEKSGGD